MIFGWLQTHTEQCPSNIVRLSIDGKVFGVFEVGWAADIEFESPQDAQKFAYALPQRFADGNAHNISLESKSGEAILVSRVLQTPEDPELLTAKRHSVSICAIIKNESRYLLEWLAYHRIMGIDHFFIYDNESDDGTTHILESIERSGWLTVIPWSSAEKHSPQVQAYNHALSEFSSLTEWMLFQDADEFVVLDSHASVADFLSMHQGASAVALNWVLFGSNGLTAWENRPVMQRFVRHAAEDFPPNRHAKVIVRPGLMRHMGIHHGELTFGHFTSPSGRRIEPATFHGLTPDVDWEHALINHYFCKSKEEWMIKRNRGKADLPADSPIRFRDDGEFTAHDQNLIEDRSILRRFAEVKAELVRIGREHPEIAKYLPENDAE